MGEAEDIQKFAAEFQNAADGGFNPFSLFTGSSRFHSLFLAPFAPSMLEAMAQFQQDGTGPLAEITQQFQQQGLAPAEARQRASELLTHAQGMLVIIMANDQGLTTIPQLFFGHLEEDYRKHVVTLCGEDFGEKDAVQAALIALSNKAEHKALGAELFATADGDDDAHNYWADLAYHLLEGLDEGIMPGMVDRLRDLGHWAGSALAGLRQSGAELDGGDYLAAARCHVVAGEIEQACAAASMLLNDFEPEDELLMQFIDQLVAAAIRESQPQLAVGFLNKFEQEINDILGGFYELELAKFKAMAAAQSSADDLIAQGEALKKADRKSFRHDLNREPLWAVTIADPGELLCVDEAAEVLDRSIQFVAKRLDNRTIPSVQRGDDVSIPQAGLEAWHKLTAHFELLD